MNNQNDNKKPLNPAGNNTEESTSQPNALVPPNSSDLLGNSEPIQSTSQEQSSSSADTLSASNTDTAKSDSFESVTTAENAAEASENPSSSQPSVLPNEVVPPAEPAQTQNYGEKNTPCAQNKSENNEKQPFNFILWVKQFLPKKSNQQREMKVNTSVNIKKAAAKKVMSKVGKTTLLVLKKAFQWTLNVFLTLLLMCTICGIIIGGAFAVYIKGNLIEEDFDIEGLKTGLDMTTKIYCKDPVTGEYVELEDERIYGDQNRSWVSFKNMPPRLYNAFVAIEDERFFEHSGVDWKRTFGAVFDFARGKDSYGGSTITQQLIKNFTGEDDTTIQRKVSEIFRALTLTEKRSKEEVLEMYLNTIHLSRRNYGVQAAANYYFGKDVSELSLVECAALASIPKSPTKYDPVRNPEHNKARRQNVIEKMYELEMITEQEYKEAINADLELKITLEESQTESETPYSYYKDALIEQLIVDFGEKYGYTREYATNLIYSGGLKIYICMDQEVQAAMDEVFQDPDSFEKKTEGIQPEAAMVVMDPYTGDVLGIVGGRGEKTGRRELNRATQSRRQVGSSIKPITVYAPAVNLEKIDYSTLVDDSPAGVVNGREWPRNSPNRYDGNITINEAIYRSKNTVAVKVLRKLGLDYAFDFAKNKLHLTSLEDADKAEAPLALGGLTHGLTVMEMTAAYTIFPNNGNYSAPRLYERVLDSEGTVLLENRIKPNSVISENSSKVMTKMLQNVVSQGTASKLEIDKKINVAGKTGSTNDNKDLYFVGYTPYYVGACWFGYDIPKNLNAYKTNPSMIAWELVMEKIHQKHFDKASSGEEALKTFSTSDMVQATYCLDSGLLATENCKIDIRTINDGISRTGTAFYSSQDDIPKKTCTVHIPVLWDKVQNCQANEYCPTENVIQVSLVDTEDRNYKASEVSKIDSQYIYGAKKCTVHKEPEEIIEPEPPKDNDLPDWFDPEQPTEPSDEPSDEPLDEPSDEPSDEPIDESSNEPSNDTSNDNTENTVSPPSENTAEVNDETYDDAVIDNSYVTF